MGYFVTKLTAVGTGGKGKGKKAKKRRKKGGTFTIGGVSNKQLTTFTRQFSTLQDAGLPVLRSLKILEHQMKPGVLKNSLMAVVIFVAVSILTFIMVAIIPKFKKIFDDFNMRLPWATEVLIQTSMWFADYWWVLPLFPMGLFILIKLVRMSRSGAYAVDRMKLWIPLTGKILEKSITARTMRDRKSVV